MSEPTTQIVLRDGTNIYHHGDPADVLRAIAHAEHTGEPAKLGGRRYEPDKLAGFRVRRASPTQIHAQLKQTTSARVTSTITIGKEPS